MRNPDRIDIILKEISEIWKNFPDLRLGQLITNVVQDPILYYIEDKDLVKFLKEFYGSERKMD